MSDIQISDLTSENPDISSYFPFDTASKSTHKTGLSGIAAGMLASAPIAAAFGAGITVTAVGDDVIARTIQSKALDWLHAADWGGSATVQATLKARAGTLSGQQAIVAGYATVGDGGGGLFVWDNASTATADNATIVAATGVTTGRWFRIYTGLVSVKWFGAKGDGVTDDTAALNLAFATCAVNRYRVFIPPGVYVITSSLWLSGESNIYGSFHIEGAGSSSGEFADAIYRAKTVIDARAVTDAPAMVTGAARGSYIGKLAVYGPNAAPRALSLSAYSENATWVTSGVRDSQYSPQAGLCIGGMIGATPPDGGYPGLTYKGIAAGAINVTVEGVAFRDHVCSILLSPDSDNNNEQVKINSCYFSGFKVALASGGSQNRSNSANGSHFEVGRTITATDEYGTINGNFIPLNDCQGVVLFEIAKGSVAWSGLHVTGGRYENIIHIARLGASTIRHWSKLNRVQISISNGRQPRSVMATLGQAPLEIDGCIIIYTGSVVGNRTWFATKNAQVKIRNTTLNCSNPHEPFSIGTAGRDDLISCEDVDVYNNSSQRITIGQTTYVDTLPARLILDGVSWLQTRTRRYRPVLRTGAMKLVDFNVIPELNNGVVTVTSSYVPGTRLMVGDTLHQQTSDAGAGYYVAVMRVTSVSGNTITADALVHVDHWTPAHSYYYARQTEWAPGVALTGDLTNGSPTVVNVTSTASCKVGDWIDAAAGIAADTRIIAIGSGTFTLDRNATADRTAEPLYWAQLVEE